MNGLPSERIPNEISRRSILGGSAALLSTALGSRSGAAQQAGASADRAARGDRMQIAVTIDDGPATGTNEDLEAYQQITSDLRNAFVAEQVPVMMFINERQLQVTGQRDARAAAVAQWLDEGLELGNHTYAHTRPEPDALWRYLDDIVRGEVVSRTLLRERGQKLEWFRYPFLASSRGETAARIEAFLTERGYRIAPVTVDYKDYRHTSNYMRLVRSGQSEEAEQYFQGVLKAVDQAFERSEQQSQEVLGYLIPQVLLIHCNAMNAATMPRTLQRIRDRGYEFVTLAEALRDPTYQRTDLPPGTLGGGNFFSALAGEPSGHPN